LQSPPDLRQQLAEILRNRAAVAGVGNPDFGDDGAGVWLAEALPTAGCRDVFVAGTTPEQLAPQLARRGFKRILFLDAVDFGGRPGEVIMLDGREIQSRFPQVSTHKISLGTVARMIEQEYGAGVWLLGIQPKSLHPGRASEVVQKTVRLLAEMLREILGPGPAPVDAAARCAVGIL
jgi:hydrogenase maturation protease